MTESAIALLVERMSVRLGAIEVFRDLSFEVHKGTCVAVIGPNGAGKTVLLKALIGALPYQGDVRWAANTALGYVPQKLDIERDLPLNGGISCKPRRPSRRLQTKRSSGRCESLAATRGSACDGGRVTINGKCNVARTC
jgi:zinc transport system ATP-binding protein